jgi:hypothetical protein
MNIADVMIELADQLDTIDGLRVHAYLADSINAPAAVVGLPETYTFDATYGRGMDRMTLPVMVLVGKVSDRTVPARLGKYMDGSGSASFKQVLEGGTYTAFDMCRVMNAETDVIEVAKVEYWAATFNVDIAGDGSA